MPAAGRLARLGHAWVQRLGAWASWRHPVWFLGLLLLGGVLLLTRALSPPPPPPSSPTIVAPSMPPAPAVSSLDPALVAVLVAARQEAVALGQQRLHGLVGTLRQRVETAFLPHYLSFGRRKLEEVKAYNTFALAWLKGVMGGDQHDTAMEMLVATFQESFSERVLTPEATQQALHAVGRDIARLYGNRVALALQDLQETRGLSFMEWRRYLEELPPVVVSAEAGQASPLRVSLATLAMPDPIREHLGEAIGAALENRFITYPAITGDLDALRLSDGQSIFDVGSNAWAYYGSYVVYWIVLIWLVRSGFIPINLSGALLGWLIWETFVWSTWIGLEALDFEHTRMQFEPVILQRTDSYFTGLRESLTDAGPTGAFRALLVLEQGAAAP